jgi:acetylglutamate kinase
METLSKRGIAVSLISAMACATQAMAGPIATIKAVNVVLVHGARCTVLGLMDRVGQKSSTVASRRFERCFCAEPADLR